MPRPLGRVLLVLAAGVVVALASAGGRLLVPALALERGALLAVRVAGGLVAVGGAALLLTQRRRILATGARSPDPTVVGLRTAATIMVVLTALATLAPRVAARRAGDGGGFSGSIPLPLPRWGLGGGSGDNDPPPPVRGGDSQIRSTPRDVSFIDPGPLGPTGPDQALVRRVTGTILLLFLLLVAFMFVRGRMRRSVVEVPEPPLPPVAPKRAEEGLEATLEELLPLEGDPRQQITAAYQRLLAALASADAGREPQEAPYEYLRRVLVPLGIRAEPLLRLTELYVLAWFSPRPVGEEHRAAAIAALTDSLGDLRARGRT